MGTITGGVRYCFSKPNLILCFSLGSSLGVNYIRLIRLVAMMNDEADSELVLNLLLSSLLRSTGIFLTNHRTAFVFYKPLGVKPSDR